MLVDSVALGGGGTLEIGKMVEENWSYLPGVYTVEEEAEIPEILSKNWGKVNFQ